jgi:hypothetical protein
MKALKRIYIKMKKEKILKAGIAQRGGPEARAADRKGRQTAIRKRKAVIIQGLLNSWDIGEIRKPTRELYDRLRFFSHGLSMSYLESLEREYWM